MVVTMTNNAKVKLSELIRQGGKSALLYIKGGGCHGFSYKFSILETETKPNKLDEEYRIDDYCRLYLCNKSIMYLIGLKIDYVDDIMGSRFDFTNDNIQSKCGCGTSFAFKDTKR
jgi:iron-sulfur cluster assembly accessory protein